MEDNINRVKINPFIKVDSKPSPFVKLDGSDNDPGVIVITKDNKEYIKGDKLYIKYKGIGVFADLTEAISINTYNDEIYIFRYDELSPPTEREYLLLLVYLDDDMMDTFTGISGRQDVFDYIVLNADLIDFVESKILAETTQMKDMWTVYQFMKMCIDNDMVKNPTGFDLSDYGSIMITNDMED